MCGCFRCKDYKEINEVVREVNDEFLPDLI